jgi:hypothetical protein
MPDHNDSLNTQGKVQILLQEYASLRMEIIHRTGHMHQLLAVGGALFLWLASRPIDIRFWISLVAAVVVVGLFGWFLHRDIDKAAERIRQLEEDINRRAGEELLVWERRWGGAVTGYWGKARPI